MLDVVYTWVDGERDDYRQSCLRYSQQPGDLNPERYRDPLQLLRYSLRSLHRHFRCDYGRLYLVTQRPHVPAWLNTGHPRLRLVHHDEIFANPAHLPTFSSNAIELQLHRIPGLAERFVYFTDDLLLGSEVTSADLMDREGRPRYARGSNQHLPHLILKAHLEPMLASRPEEFQAQLESRFRHSSYFPLDRGYQQFLIEAGAGSPYPESFMRRHRFCWQVGDNAETDWPPLDRLIRAAFGRKLGRTRLWLWITWAALQYCRWARPKFICLNDDLGPHPSPRHLGLARRFLERMYPDPSPFESG